MGRGQFVIEAAALPVEAVPVVHEMTLDVDPIALPAGRAVSLDIQAAAENEGIVFLGNAEAQPIALMRGMSYSVQVSVDPSSYYLRASQPGQKVSVIWMEVVGG